METSVKERLTAYLTFKRISKSEFGRLIGVSNAYVSSIKASPSPDKLEAISSNFPDLSIEWLLTGKGEMLKKAEEKNGDNNSGVVIKGNNQISNSPIDNKPDYDYVALLKRTIDLLEKILAKNDEQIAKKDAEINRLLEIIENK